MIEPEMLRPFGPLSWAIAWQSSAFLAAGLVASFALRRRPARAHKTLLLAMAAAVAAPILSDACRRLGWGLWEAPATPVALAVAEPVVIGPSPTPVGFELPRREVAPMVEDVASYGLREPAGSFPWRLVGLAAWALASGALALRLIATLADARRLAARSVVVEDAAIRMDLQAACASLGVAVQPAISRSAEVRCPAIWCWSRPPRLLLPEGEGRDVDRAAIFRHELAHLRRRDHLSTLAAEGLVCLIPWNPLAWATRSRLARLAELACDDWVVATGASPEDYAETLLNLTPHRPAPALASVVGRGGLRGRIARILSDVRRDPVAGRRWTVALSVFIAGVVALVVLARSRPNDAHEMVKAVRGRVVGPDGQPVAGVRVRAVVRKLPWLPSNVGHLGRPGPESIAMTEPVATDAEGRFVVHTSARPSSHSGEIGLFATAPEFGLAVIQVTTDAIGREHQIRMTPGARIEGRLLAPDGTPATDVDVRVRSFRDAGGEGSTLGSLFRGESAPDFWPKPTRTDAEGRFTLLAPNDAYVQLALSHPRYAAEDVMVNTTGGAQVPESLKGPGFIPVPPAFTHSFRPARFVEGRVTDRETGAPAADVIITMTQVRTHVIRSFESRTDSDGRYRAAVDPEGHFDVTATPSDASGYLAASTFGRSWPPEVEVLTVDLSLDRGRRITGRVMDVDSGRPVVAASVAYAPLWSNQARNQEATQGLDVMTDGEGRFALSGLAGPGFLAVETDDPGRMRGSRTPPGFNGRVVHAQGYATVLVPEKGEPEPVEISVRRGVTIEARVVDPEGRPVEAYATYSGNHSVSTYINSRGDACPGGALRIEGADPDRTYRVLFTHTGRRLGGVAELKYEPGVAPAVVKLQPTASLRGRFVGPDQTPLALPIYARVLFEALGPEAPPPGLEDGDRSGIYDNILGPERFGHFPSTTDADGGFRLDGLIPGVGLYVAAGEFRSPAKFPVWDLKPGEDRDLGTLEVAAPKDR